jgi:hypothetical protein
MGSDHTLITMVPPFMTLIFMIMATTEVIMAGTMETTTEAIMDTILTIHSTHHTTMEAGDQAI